MKKLLIFTLVLGIGTLATAGLQISVNGVLEPVDSEITLEPSQEILLDVWTDAPIAPFSGHTWALVVSSLNGTITGGAAIPGPVGVNQVNGIVSENDTLVPPPGSDGIWGSCFNVTTTPVGDMGLVLVDQILFHCEGPLDAVVELYEVVENEPFANLMDTVIIHQIPEPASLALLGLGGLLLRRRK